MSVIKCDPSKFEEHIHLLRKIATFSSLTHKHSACLIKGGKVYTFGYNRYIKRDRVNDKYIKYTIHAEIDALCKLKLTKGFTIEEGKLFLLQTRGGKRTGAAGIKIAVDMANEGLLTREEAVASIDVNAVDQLLHPVFEEKSMEAAEILTTGLAASPGAASGKIVFSSEKAALLKEETGEKLLLFRNCHFLSFN